MSEVWVWGLFAAVIAISFSFALKTAELRHELKLTEKVISGLWKEIDALKERNNQSIPDEQNSNVAEIDKTSNVNHKEELFYKILTSIAKYHSQEIPATPEIIGKDIALDSEITLAYMWKYHNEQYITFRTGGKKPSIETPFFLSPKALEEIQIIKKQT